MVNAYGKRILKEFHLPFTILLSAFIGTFTLKMWLTFLKIRLQPFFEKTSKLLINSSLNFYPDGKW